MQHTPDSRVLTLWMYVHSEMCGHHVISLQVTMAAFPVDWMTSSFVFSHLLGWADAACGHVAGDNGHHGLIVRSWCHIQ